MGWAEMKFRRGTDPDEHRGFAFEITPGDLWIGAFVRHRDHYNLGSDTGFVVTHLYVILIPTLVFHFWWDWVPKKKEAVSHG